jgi:hypothetical protein
LSPTGPDRANRLRHPSAAPQLQPPPPKSPPPAKAVPPTGKFRILEMRLRELLLWLTDAPPSSKPENVKQVIAVESKAGGRGGDGVNDGYVPISFPAIWSQRDASRTANRVFEPI